MFGPNFLYSFEPAGKHHKMQGNTNPLNQSHTKSVYQVSLGPVLFAPFIPPQSGFIYFLRKMEPFEYLLWDFHLSLYLLGHAKRHRHQHGVCMSAECLHDAVLRITGFGVWFRSHSASLEIWDWNPSALVWDLPTRPIKEWLIEKLSSDYK